MNMFLSIFPSRDYTPVEDYLIRRCKLRIKMHEIQSMEQIIKLDFTALVDLRSKMFNWCETSLVGDGYYDSDQTAYWFEKEEDRLAFVLQFRL